MQKSAITPDQLKRLLSYNPLTGELTWLPRPQSMFVTASRCKAWNSANAGKPALATVGAGGYRYGTVLSQTHYAHRVIWALVHNAEPRMVDHINGDRADNRLVNLRSVDDTENARNSARNTNNTSGHTGVYLDKRQGKWFSAIMVNRRSLFLGTFETIDAAVAARKEAEARYGFHANHGRHA